jgi:hypothetical protein
VDEHAPQPLLDAQGLEEPLLLGHRQLDVAGDEIGEPARIGDGVQNLMNDLLGKTAALPQLGGALARLLVQGDERGILDVGRLHLFGRHDHGVQVPVRGAVLKRGRALLALQQKLNAAETALDLTDPRDDAHRVQDVRRRLVRVVALSDGEHQALPAKRGFDGAQGARSARGDRRRETRENHRPPKREDGQRLTLCHSVT